MIDELKPCPFCGDKFSTCIYTMEENENFHFVSCKCGAQGPKKNSIEKAISAWNNTSVLLWTRYDGTEETLPDVLSRCLVMRDKKDVPIIATCYMRVSGYYWEQWFLGTTREDRIQENDIWAYLPTAEMENASDC